MPSEISFARYFADLPDPRVDRTKWHRLGLDPFAYLRDALIQLPTLPADCLGELLPVRWAAGRACPAG